jgi:hypothetical protein
MFIKIFAAFSGKICSVLTRRVFVYMLPTVILFLTFSTSSVCQSVILDRIIAYVDERAITYSELSERYMILKKAAPGVTEEETLNSMINALLMLQKAKKLRLEAPTEDDLIKEYLDVTVRSRIAVSEDKLLEYYNKNRSEFKDKAFSEVRVEIEKYLMELETNVKLKEHLKELRAGANIVIQLKDK